MYLMVLQIITALDIEPMR